MMAALCGLWLLSSCIRDVVVELPEQDPQLALTCTFTADSVWEAFVSRSAGVLEEISYEGIDNATVLLLENGTVIDTLQLLGLGFYSGNGVPLAGHTYTMQVSAPGLETITASNAAPVPVPLLSVAYDDSAQITVFDETLDKISFSFADAAGSAQFYAVVVYALYPYIDGVDTVWYPSAVSLFTDDVKLNDAIYYQTELVFSDELFDGETPSFTVFANSYEMADSLNYVIKLATLSEDYYRYVTSLSKYWSAQGNPFSEPVLIHSNVQNGLGVLAGFSADTARVK